MNELTVIDTVPAHTIEVGDIVDFHTATMTVKSINDEIEDITFSGTDEFGDDFDLSVDAYMSLSLMGYAADEDEDI